MPSLPAVGAVLFAIFAICEFEKNECEERRSSASNVVCAAGINLAHGHFKRTLAGHD